ncbi:hypothetical protein LVB77_10450 [Lysobacter sp. 5GHs7-4]|uniref:hypothetical protein n=1 Tax=Lysobacter sp. 5GHs7-4 TaxID=2904253 RepID=UPI0017A5673A|nr:hypothetical protein [Lysobacter sp. 5GHs7-4]NUO76796.1 hypothetical protein [Lysobacter sp.]UHQ25060.1 hypothetical protein LVB77_10450 [Lysobacter sp. 5GHs7-4]
MRRTYPLRATRIAWPLALALSVLGLSACQPQAPANAAAPEGTTAAPPPALPSPDPNAAPVERAAPPVIKPVALGEFEPGNPVATAATGKLNIEDAKLQGANGASFGTERVALVSGGDEYSAGATYAASMQIDASQPVELRHVVEQTPPTDQPANAFCGGAPTAYIALAKVGEGEREVVKVLALQGEDLPAPGAKGVSVCAVTTYLVASR